MTFLISTDTVMINYADETRLGKPIPELGLGPDNTMFDAVQAIAQRLAAHDELLEKELFPSVAGASSSDIVHTGSVGNGLGIEAQKLQGSALKIRLERSGDQAATLQFDASNIPLPEGARVTASRTSISGQSVRGETQILNTQKNAMQISIDYNRFPITVDTVVTVNTKDGDVELRRTQQISADQTGEQVTGFEILDRTNTNASTNLSDVIHRLEDRVTYLETKK